MQTRPDPSTRMPPSVPGFELGACIGEGATSEVWAAASEADGRRVAVKVVHADLGEVDAAAREAALSALASSTHVVQVEACLPLDDGRVALVMPLMRGGSLGALVAARGHLEPGEVVTLLAPVASALGRLHRVGVVHGDVSPGNVLLDVDGRPHLADLGLGHVVGEVSPGVWGSDGYVAPEVVLGGDATAAADVYSVGALGWLCLSGTVPGAPGLRPSLADVTLAEPGPSLAALVEVLDGAIDPDAGRRPGADALAWALFEAAEPMPLHLVTGADDVSAITRRLRAAAGEPGPDATPRGRAGVHRAAGSRRRPGPVRVVLGALAALLLAALAVAWLSPGFGAAGSREAGDPRLDATAPTHRAHSLLVSLAAARASAWRSGDPDLLRGADAPGSKAWADDVAAVSALRQAGIRYTGLHHGVAGVSTAEATADRAVLRARIDTSGYAVEGAGAATQRPATRGTAVLVELVRTDAGWRISEVRGAG